MHLLRCLACGLLALVVGIQAGRAQTTRFRPVLAPRELSRHLVKARKDFDAGEYASMCERLEPLLKADAKDGFFGDSEHREGLRWATRDFCLALSGEARESFELKFGATAQRALDQAIGSDRVGDVEKVARSFPGTRAGVDAAIIVARRRIDQGAFRAAAAILEPIWRNIPWAEDLQPELSLTLALAFRQSGRFDKSSEVLQQLAAVTPPADLEIGGEPASWKKGDPEGLEAWARRWLPARQRVARRVALSEPPGSREVRLAWRAPLNESDASEALLGELVEQFATAGPTTTPCPRPVASEHCLVVRNAERLLGVAASGGKRIWMFPHRSESRSAPRLVTRSTGDNPRMLTPAGLDLMRKSYVDKQHAAISQDGEQLYFLGELANPKYTGHYSHYLQMAPTRVGSRFLDPSKNLLYALDLKGQGKLRWILGGPNSAAPELKASYFVGAPVNNSGVLYVQAEQDGELCLAALQPETGRLIWKQTLVNVSESKIEKDFRRRFDAARIAFHDEGIVCWTAAEQLIGLGYDGELRWQSILFEEESKEESKSKQDGDKSPIQLTPPGLQNLLGQRNMSKYYREVIEAAKQITPGDRWADVGLACSRRFCVVTPPGGEEAICVSLSSGRVQWRRRRGDFLYVGCCHRGGVLLVGKYRLGWLDLESGKPRIGDFPFLAMPSSGVPCGQGALWGGEYWIPTTEHELLQLDLATGKMTVHQTDEVLGNLVVAGNRLVSQSPVSVTAFEAWDGESVAEAATPVSVEDDPGAQRWIQQLGADSFVLREEAEQRLREMGTSVMAAVREAAKSPDPEVRLRSQRILAALRKSELQQMVERFREGKEEKLPGWSQFKDVAGDSKTTRELYCEIFETQGDLFRPLVSNDLSEAIERAREQAKMLQQSISAQYQPTFAEVAAIVFVSSLKYDATLLQSVSSLCFQAKFSQKMNDSKAGPELKKFLIKLYATEMDPNVQHQMVNLGVRYQLAQCLPLARKILADKNAQHYYKSQAIIAVSQFGSLDEDETLLRSQFEHTQTISTWTRNNERLTTQVGDVALAAMVFMSRRQPKAFGFEHAQKVNFQNPQQTLQAHYLGFASDAKRKEARKQWTRFRMLESEGKPHPFDLPPSPTQSSVKP